MLNRSWMLLTSSLNLVSQRPESFRIGMRTAFIKKHSKRGNQMKKSRLLALLALSAVLAVCAETISAPDVKPDDKPVEEPGAEL